MKVFVAFVITAIFRSTGCGVALETDASDFDDSVEV